jgi:hypothetical protein
LAARDPLDFHLLTELPRIKEIIKATQRGHRRATLPSRGCTKQSM